MALNSTDVGLLNLLQADARMSNKDLADAVGLSPSACLERVRRLVRDGVITGFHASVDPDAVGAKLETMLTVGLQKHSRRVIDDFQKHCLALEEVVAVWHLTGTSDFVLRVMTRDHNHLRDFLMDSFTTRAEVSQLQTHVVLAATDKFKWPIWP
jgi:DNA-binding Lrp family transcriptional regulator